MLHYFLGSKISHTSVGYILIEKKFTKDILTDCPFDLTKAAVTPFPLNLKLSADDTPLYDDVELYRCYTDELNFLTYTRPNISFVVHSLSQFIHIPMLSHV